MELIIDLHVHSHYSRATSKDCTFEGLYKWGKLKGLNIIGSGDFTHPEWFNEMRAKLEPAEWGLFKLKEDLSREVDKTLPDSVRNNFLRFVPSVEVSTIYSKGGKVRKLHQLIVVPTFQAASKINSRLGQIGNLKADGRPFLGLDSKELLRLALDADPNALFIPAHIWTPWFGLFGSRSGFDSIAEAYEEMAPEIKVIETGLSSDPPMNWRVKELDDITIISNSDAHSPQKLGREASMVNCELNYQDLIGAMKTNDERFQGTIEFFPQEGKYYADGHRLCNVRFTPQETKAHSGICPRCGKPLTVGVNYRVDELATQPEGYQSTRVKQVDYIIPLPEIVAELKNVKSTSSVAVTQECEKIYGRLGDEFSILRKLPIGQIRESGFDLLAVAVQRLRAREVAIEPGYDGTYGTIRLFEDSERSSIAPGQTSLL